MARLAAARPRGLARDLSFAIVAIGLVAARPAAARGADPACAEAHLAAQKHRAAGELSAAKEALLVCASARCPRLVQADCTKWVDEVEAETATVVFSAKDAAGSDVAGATLSVDGVVVSDALSGRAVPLDPGTHRVRVEASGREPAEVDVVVRAGEKLQPVAVTLAPAGPATPPESREPPVNVGSRIAIAVLAPVSVASLIAFAGLAIAGEVEFADLEDTCAPRCAQSDADAVQAKFIAADVLLGVGLATGVAAFAVWIIVPLVDTPDGGGAPASARLGVEPVPGGAAAVLRGTF